jgi:hypothetical protein
LVLAIAPTTTGAGRAGTDGAGGNGSIRAGAGGEPQQPWYRCGGLHLGRSGLGQAAPAGAGRRTDGTGREQHRRRNGCHQQNGPRPPTRHRIAANLVGGIIGRRRISRPNRVFQRLAPKGVGFAQKAFKIRNEQTHTLEFEAAVPVGQVGRLDLAEAGRWPDRLDHDRDELALASPLRGLFIHPLASIERADHKTTMQRIRSRARSSTLRQVSPAGMRRSHHTVQPADSSIAAIRRASSLSFSV